MKIVNCLRGAITAHPLLLLLHDRQQQPPKVEFLLPMAYGVLITTSDPAENAKEGHSDGLVPGK